MKRSGQVRLVYVKQRKFIKKNVLKDKASFAQIREMLIIQVLPNSSKNHWFTLLFLLFFAFLFLVVTVVTISPTPHHPSIPLVLSSLTESGHSGDHPSILLPSSTQSGHSGDHPSIPLPSSTQSKHSGDHPSFPLLSST